MVFGTDALERRDAGKVPRVPEFRLGVLRHLGLKDVERKEQRHARTAARPHQETAPSIFPAQRVQDYGILTELGVVEYYQFSLRSH